jgi:2-oxoglutarate ferredoxin oxidoreductase subunit beta
VPHFEDISVEYDPGTTFDVRMHDGSHLRLRKLQEDYDPASKINAVRHLMEAHEKGEVLTGVFYIDTQKPNFVDLLNMTETPLSRLPQEAVRPPKQALEEVMESLR